MSGRPPARRGLLAAAALAALAAAPASADLLVLRSGVRLETRGAWSERGPLVVFTDAAGALRSMRASEIDLAASREATAAARAPAAPATAPPASKAPRESILRLTEKDLPPVADPEAFASSDGVAAEAPRVVLYSTSWCGWCRRTRELFASLGVVYVDKDVERDPSARREQLALTGGSDAVPVVDWNGRVIRGFAEATFRELASPPTSTPQPRASASAPQADG